VVTIPAENLGWSDIGDWQAMADIQQVDKDGNVIQGREILTIDSKIQ